MGRGKRAKKEVVFVVRIVPVRIGGKTAVGVEVRLPKTTLLAIDAGIGYIMCGALDIRLLDERLKDRGVVAGRAVGVRTLEELLEAPLEAVTKEAERLGVRPGMAGKEAVARMMGLEEPSVPDHAVR